MKTIRLSLGFILGSFGAASQAATLTASYSFSMNQGVSFSMGSLTGAQTAGIHGVRTGGDTALLPGAPYAFETYCVEVTEHIHSGSQTHSSVTNLLGSTTVTGGVFFDAVRTTRIEKLWGTFFATIGSNQSRSAAFQLAQWEICFDTDMNLGGAGTFTSSDSVSALAQTFLDAISNGSATQRQGMILLSGEGIQDQVTPVPEPASMVALSLGAAALLRRRKLAR
ncbi:MAG: PEP-CTERM sorting domain-containing protein [Chthonomonas sp.]|nr:PEP-CTERM sorting domain-containing protein [Chthonomonas sp.]